MERTFAPYIVYRSSKGNMTVAGYQIANPAEPLARNEWRNLSLEKLRSVRLTDDTFTPDHSFNPFDKRYVGGIVCNVKQNIR